MYHLSQSENDKAPLPPERKDSLEKIGQRIRGSKFGCRGRWSPVVLLVTVTERAIVTEHVQMPPQELSVDASSFTSSSSCGATSLRRRFPLLSAFRVSPGTPVAEPIGRRRQISRDTTSIRWALTRRRAQTGRNPTPRLSHPPGAD